MTIKHWFLIIKTKFCVYMNLMYYPPRCSGFERTGDAGIKKINEITCFKINKIVYKTDYRD